MSCCSSFIFIINMPNASFGLLPSKKFKWINSELIFMGAGVDGICNEQRWYRSSKQICQSSSLSPEIFPFQQINTPFWTCIFISSIKSKFQFDVLKCHLFHFRWCGSDFMILFTLASFECASSSRCALLDQCVNHKNDETQVGKRRESLLRFLNPFLTLNPN